MWNPVMTFFFSTDNQLDISIMAFVPSSHTVKAWYDHLDNISFHGYSLAHSSGYGFVRTVVNQIVIIQIFGALSVSGSSMDV